MATNSQGPEYQTFREHYERLVTVIQDPLPLANRLFSRGIIDVYLLQRLNTRGLGFENTTTLLIAVLAKIQCDPNTFYVFMSALKEDPSLKSLVESMESKCFCGEDV